VTPVENGGSIFSSEAGILNNPDLRSSATRIACLNRFISTVVLLKIFSSGQLKVDPSLKLRFFVFLLTHPPKSNADNFITSILLLQAGRHFIRKPMPLKIRSASCRAPE
jgi:hypothetical protein